MYNSNDYYGDTNAARIEDELERIALGDADAEIAHAAFLENEALECAAADEAEARYFAAAPVAFALNGWLKAVSMRRAA